MKPEQFLNNKDLTTESAVAAALALAHLPDPAAVRLMTTGGGPDFLITQKGLVIESLEKFKETPHRAKIRVALDTAKDIHSYILAQALLPTVGAERTESEDNPVIFASRENQSITAFIDYHHKEEDRWLNHTAFVQYKHSHQFKRWLDQNNKHMTQDQFALFIDEMLQDFESPEKEPGKPKMPTAAEMLSFATSLEVYSDQVFKSSTKLASGETEFTFTDARKGDVSTKIIDEFTIGIPIWQGGQKIAVTAKLFHRLVDNKDSAGAPTGTKSLRFWFTLRHVERIIDALFAKEVEFLQTAFKGIAPIYSGTAPTIPEALTLDID